MVAMAMRWGIPLLALVAMQAHGQSGDTPIYKCRAKGEVVYTYVPCGKALDQGKPRVNVRYETPSQDRAKIARRSVLSAEARQECTALDARMHEQEAEFKSKGAAATLEDEMPLVRSKKRYRELKC